MASFASLVEPQHPNEHLSFFVVIHLLCKCILSLHLCVYYKMLITFSCKKVLYSLIVTVKFASKLSGGILEIILVLLLLLNILYRVFQFECYSRYLQIDATDNNFKQETWPWLFNRKVRIKINWYIHFYNIKRLYYTFYITQFLYA